MNTDTVELSNAQKIRDEYESAGFLRNTYPLADSRLVDELRKDVPMYLTEVTRNKSDKLFRVPYLMTQSIVTAAHDLNILRVVTAALGSDELVMWGPNIQRGTPNEASLWHTDIESWYWPSLTVAVGLSGCSQENSTIAIAGTHKFPVQPWSVAHNWKNDDILAAARHIDPASDKIENFRNFAPGRFYVFNAKTWHCGVPISSGTRELMFLHFQKASDPRIPYFKNYDERTWFDYPAAYWKINTGKSFEVNQAMYSSEGRDFVGPQMEYRRPGYNG
jgi:hypothetical protein